MSAPIVRAGQKNEAIIGSRAVLHSTPEQKEYSTTLKSLYTKKVIPVVLHNRTFAPN